MKKHIKKTISILLAAIVILMVFLLPGCFYEFERIIEGDFIVLDFSEGHKELYIEGLSEEGKQKEIIVVPEFLRGKAVKGFGRAMDNFSFCWQSEKLEKVYLNSNFERISMALSSELLPNGRGCPNLKKVIYILQINDNGSNYLQPSAPSYCSRKWHENNESEWFEIANVSYYWNYEESPNNGYYWLDDIDYDTKITFVPNNPIREGFVFGGWFKEAECLTQWNFETDKTPQGMLDGNNKIIYQETILYAKWLAV